MMLQRFLLARAAQNRDIEPVQPPESAEPAAIEALDMKLRVPSLSRSKQRQAIDPDDPMHFSMPTLQELESQVRRHSVGRTIAEICLDLGVTPSLCDGEAWDQILQSLMHVSTNIAQFFETRQRRQQTAQEERDKCPETWDIDWRDRPTDAFRQSSSGLLGESVPVLT